MQEFIMSFIENYGYIAVMLLICVENVFPPIPSEVILTFAGFMVSRTNLSIVGLILASTIGALVGAFILYYIGRLLNKERLDILKKDVLIVDLASVPGGVDFTAAKELGLNVVWALSLPSKCAPKSAARYLKEEIESIFR